VGVENPSRVSHLSPLNRSSMYTTRHAEASMIFPTGSLFSSMVVDTVFYQTSTDQ
jgi:hypothetical protein